VRVPLTPTFDGEKQRYRLVFACEDCVYHDRAQARCSHGYPDEVHRRAAFEPDGPRDGMFCKEFEIA
jgi:hypothetical protein